MKKIFVLILFFIVQALNAQDILIPYLIGNKYGLSDYSGKLVVPAYYDLIKPQRADLFEFTKGSKKGILQGGKELLSSEVFLYFNIEYDNFIIGHERHCVTVHTLKGKELISCIANLNIADSILKYNKGRASQFYVMIAKATDKSYSLFVYDVDKQEITDWLLRGQNEIHVENVSSGNTNLKTIRVRKTAYDYKEEYVLTLENNNIKLVKPVQDNGRERVENDDEPYAPVFIQEPDNSSGSKNIRIRYLAGGNRIFAIINTNGEVIEREIKFPFELNDIRVETHEYNTKSGETSVTYDDAVFFSDKAGKKGYYIADSIMVKPVYDEFRAMLIEDSINGNVINIVVGVKDKTGTTLYGTLNMKGEEIIPAEYQTLDFGRGYDSYIFRPKKNIWRIVKNGKQGLVTYKNEILAEPIYDNIDMNNNHINDRPYDFITLEKDGKYGLLLNKDDKKIFVDAVLTGIPTGCIIDYHNSGINIMIIEDKVTGKKIYARTDGFQYSE